MPDQPGANWVFEDVPSQLLHVVVLAKDAFVVPLLP